MTDELDILLVEDDAATRANLCDILELDGHRVRFAASLAEAKRQLEAAPVSLVILDRRLPDGTSGEFLPELQLLLPGAEVIVVTGYADMDSTIEAFRSGVADYILKPINPDALRQSVRRIVRQRHMEAELHHEQKFANKILATAEAIVLVLDLSGLIRRFNPYFTKIAGWDFDELRGRDWFENCIPERDRERVRRVFLETAHEAHSAGLLNPIRTKDGRERQIRWSNTTLKDQGDAVTSVLAVGVDVTELITAQELAMRSERLAAIGQTMAGLAHESRNALQRIKASVEMLSLEIPGNSEASVDLNSIARATGDLHTLLEEVRAYAAPIHLRRRSVQLPEVWRRVWDDLEGVRCGREAVLDDGECGCENVVEVDVAKMEQVFRNLFENSLAACSDPVKISLRCQCSGPETMLVEVRDNGPGLTLEQQSQLFDPFYTTKSTGTGLGMSIVQRIIDAHGGEIRVVESTSGACFEFRLSKQRDGNPQRSCQENP
ncbi:ATP-binding protein [Aureliella helgolandensis]|uniref:histidine kinase n=1 Tax=Aureliella helgolandensis TaxID=2527968 RepID=A0A518GD42_9BACT|nr:ATP-binding protein [Aureliella helgolandensis]QDV26470.1 Sensor protein ZraS [Aureliella helgolandensis]